MQNFLSAMRSPNEKVFYGHEANQRREIVGDIEYVVPRCSALNLRKI